MYLPVSVLRPTESFNRSNTTTSTWLFKINDLGGVFHSQSSSFCKKENDLRQTLVTVSLHNHVNMTIGRSLRQRLGRHMPYTLIILSKAFQIFPIFCRYNNVIKILQFRCCDSVTSDSDGYPRDSQQVDQAG